MAIPADEFRHSAAALRVRQLLRYGAEILLIAALYVGIAKLSLRFASINPSATPIWPPTGLALAVLILRGYRLWPAIFLAAYLTNLTTAGSTLTSFAIAGGNTLEALVGAYLTNIWAGGRQAFANQFGVGRFAAVAAASTAVSASIGVLTLCLAGMATWPGFVPVWITWWLGDLAGALVVAPVIVLWAQPPHARPALPETLFLFLAAALIGTISFTGLVPMGDGRGALAFLVVLPLMWSALRCGQQETATVALILSAVAALGTAARTGPFANGTLNDSFLLLLAFILSITVPSLALSASIVTQRKAESDTRQEAQRIIEESREQLAQAQKMEALGQLTGGVAHDFNNLLHVIQGYAQLIEMRVEDDRSRRGTSAIQSAVKRGETLTRQLLSFARRQKLEPTTLDLRQYLHTIEEMLRASLRGDIELIYNVEKDVWPVKVDAAELEFALVNIAVNARDAMPDGGQLAIAARNVRLRGETAELEGDFVWLAATDTGEGIAANLIGRVFEPFFTTKPVGKGTGLGLSQVYGFAKQSGGAAAVRSTPGLGTTVSLYLPRARAQVVTASAQDESPSLGGGRGRILVVEDSADVRDLITDLLTQLGFDVETAQTARDALSHLQSGARPDLVFSDIVMPGAMNGYQLAEEMRAAFPDIPILLTSGYNDISRPRDCPFELLPKPFDLAALDQSIQRAFGSN